MAMLSIPWGLVNGKVKAVNEITEKDYDIKTGQFIS